MQKIIQKFSKSIPIGDILKSKTGKFEFLNIPEGSHSFLTVSLFEALKRNKNIIIVSPTNLLSEFLYRESLSFIDKSFLLYLPGIEGIPYEYSHFPVDIKRDRIRTLTSLESGGAKILFTSVAGFLQKLPGKENIYEKSISLSVDSDYKQVSLIRRFIDIGYKRDDICEQIGHFTVKGGIIDIFSPNIEDPIRLDFFGDTLESIKTFDLFSQRSVAELDDVTLLPPDEFSLSEDEKKIYREKILSYGEEYHKPNSEFDEIFFLEELYGLVDETTGILSYFNEKPLIVLPEAQDIKEKMYVMKREFSSIYESRKSKYICLPPENLLSFGVEMETIEKQLGVSFASRAFSGSLEEGNKLPISGVDSFRGKIRDVREKIEELVALEEANILITSSFSAQTKRLAHLFEKESIHLLNEDTEEPEQFELPAQKSGLFLVLSELRNGFVLPELNLHIWTDNDIFGRSYKKKSRYKKKSSKAIESFIDLKVGDYVVHINHGVGKFSSLEKVQADGKTRDFLKLEYSGGDTLFVPLDQISLVQRYIGGLEKPPLDSLGKSLWKKKLDRAKGSVSRLAEELLIVYANRMKMVGYSFPADTIWQEEFEAEFEYEETPDQLSAIEAVKQDLESNKPMDRLVCGDVGYGKTEVAIRAAFKVIMAGKQVLFIAPTTILALQHYNTLLNRYKNFPIRVDMVSRFRSQKEIKKTIAEFSKGDLDLLVGTHALLSPSLKPKNLGLLIIDEEQRFGVNQKDSIKKFKNLVDVLTLSATPIPRTLNMSLSGIRDLSIIETPPKNRQSIETYVVEESDELIINAVEKELERDGQVFYLYNRVESIESEANYLSGIMPHISIGILHGQLTEEEVELTIMDFNNRKYDVLVTTTIIESGIDMPNVNTIIVKRADTFGLSQLYQIRGRVGRSTRQAYAYLFYPKDRALTEYAEKRLNTIYEYQELGSGFKVAMKDLEIRGAGNILGKEQSGNIMEVGYDLYVKLLNEAVRQLKQEDVKVEIRAVMNLSTNFYIPDQYITDSRQKIEFYKKFEGATSLEEIDELSLEMEDRFGTPPDVVRTFVILEKIRVVASSIGFESIYEDSGEIKLKSGKYFSGDSSKIIELIGQKSSGLSILPNDPTILRYRPNSTAELNKIIGLLEILKKIAGIR
ncbi:MAG: transcription-repair coupling factor [Leptospiraceae bacterium]|nr:transcription-repair coupling factor [Leptospiraceae bacterium]MCP5513442.1 transcription-repair coupling factor [Leptospiraceae bacterium]